MFDYQSLRSGTAEPLIKRFGKQAFVLTRGQPTGPPENPMPGPDERKLVYFVETGYKISDRNQTLVQVGDKLGIISTETRVVPQKSSDKMEIDGIVYQFVDIQPLNPGGTVMVYEIQARK